MALRKGFHHEHFDTIQLPRAASLCGRICHRWDCETAEADFMDRPILIADIGATTTRTAFVGASGAFEKMTSVSNREAGDLSDYLADTIARFGTPRPAEAVLAVAAPVDGEEIALTNHSWSFGRAHLTRKLGIEELIVLNDFAAAALAVPHLAPSDLMEIGKGQIVSGGTQLVCGPGTGFGVAALHYVEGRAHVIASESGHMSFGATNADEARILAYLAKDLGSVVIEHLLSGAGISRLHYILHAKKDDARSIIADASENVLAAQETVTVFLRIFGRIAGDLALAFDARGGVFLAGGVVRSLAPLIAASPFLSSFQDHPPYEQRLGAVPIKLVLHSMPGLLGAASIARKKFVA
jgi:glucokinase